MHIVFSDLINDKADPQIPLQAFNLAIYKACTNKKTSSTKISIIVDDKKKDDDDEDEQNFDRSLTNWNKYNDLPRSISSLPVLSPTISGTSSPVTVEEKEKNEEFLGDKYQSDLTNNLPPGQYFTFWPITDHITKYKQLNVSSKYKWNYCRSRLSFKEQQ